MMMLGLLAAASTAAPASLPDPIGPASDGKLQCFTPNLAHKTCNSLSSFRFGDNGVIETQSTALLSASPPVTMTTRSTVTVHQGRVCGMMEPADISEARFTIAGQAADEAKASVLRAEVSNAFGPILGHMMCTSLVADGSGFDARVTLDGLPRPGVDQRVLWVAPADGWTVAP